MCVRALALGEVVALGCAGMTVYVVIPEHEDHKRLCIVLVTTAVCDALLSLVPHIRVRSMGIGDNGCNFVGQLTHKLRKFSDCSTAFEVPGYRLVSLYGNGSQQLWQLSDSTSVCVSDAFSGSVQLLSRFNMSITGYGSCRTSPWQMKQRSMSTTVHRVSAR